VRAQGNQNSLSGKGIESLVNFIAHPSCEEHKVFVGSHDLNNSADIFIFGTFWNEDMGGSSKR